MPSSKDFFDIVTTELEPDTLSDESSIIDPALSKGMLDRILKESNDVIGSFSKDLRDTTVSIASKMDKIQSIQSIALAEGVKAFETDTLDERRLFASKNLLSIAGTIQNTITHRHKLELLESVDFTNPKISKGFNFFLELFIKTLTEEGVETNQLTKILEVLEVQLYDFEIILQETFKQVPLSELAKVQNPFIQESDVDEVEPCNIFKEDVLEAEIIKPKKKTLKQRLRAKRAKAKAQK